jgi:UDP-N-acetylglucosamine 4,6-dehydratase
MYGGEIFVPKIPSVRIIDLAESLAPGVPFKSIGIRPGEKLHEIMCPSDDCHLTLEFEDHYVIKPGIKMSGEVDYVVNGLGERGQAVEQGFCYNSGDNDVFLNIRQLRELDSNSL